MTYNKVRMAVHDNVRRQLHKQVVDSMYLQLYKHVHIDVRAQVSVSFPFFYEGLRPLYVHLRRSAAP